MMQKARACRLGTPCAPRTFKQLLTCRTQHHTSIEFDAVSDRAGIRKDRLYAYCSDNDQAQIPFIALLRVCAVVENFDLVDFALEGYRLRLVAVDASPEGSVIDEAMDATVATGELVAAVQAAVAGDGGIDDVERQRVRDRIRKARRELDDLDGALDAPTIQIVRRA